MYFYKIKPLKERLAAGPLSDRESLPYFIAFITMWSFLIYLPPEASLYYIEMTVSILSAVVGTIFIYFSNGGSNGRDFVHRYVVLGWVISIRFITVLLLPGIILYAIFKPMGETNEKTLWFDVTMLLGITMLYYAYFSHHLRDLSKRMGSSEPGAAANRPPATTSRAVDR